jgi:hypothetical protein
MNQEKESAQQGKNLNRVIKIDEARIHSHLDEMVRHLKQQGSGRCGISDFRQVSGFVGGGGEILPPGPVATLHRALVQECIFGGPESEGQRSGGNAQGDSRPEG